ncbi:hypothetical protein [Oceanobacillus kimchii]|uniref:Uncharacterized protein n=1 Tax=Oceanobacillus kimchii TaxID=746691 RepID=A0ABQ5TF63_9BACI|nr:hypothetical protein [Oceanobacillus kimchii]GLO64590.1 hypothetical protein MACH08_03740 [Oceanobacillus kimchii]
MRLFHGKQKGVLYLLEWGVVILLLSFFIMKWFDYTQYHFSADAAFEEEQDLNFYGPSKKVEKVVIDDRVFYLNTYDDQFSVGILKKDFGLLWKYENSFFSIKREDEDPITYLNDGYMENNDVYSIYLVGVVNDPDIKKIRIQFNDEKTLAYPIKDSGMFAFFIEDNHVGYGNWEKLLGINKNGKVIYEKTL